MLYTIMFLVRYFPFWSIPIALAVFELGVYFYNRRYRPGFIFLFGLAGLQVVLSILWLVFEGYWRAGPFIKKIYDHYW